MAYVAACTDKGAKRTTNQDACCIQAANTRFGEVVMAIVCDGVGGLSMGELASATVVYRFVQWFHEELPVLLAGMDTSQDMDFSVIQTVWGVLLSGLNETIMAYGHAQGGMLGTTFSGLMVCNGRYLIAHVGDCRVYQLGTRGERQITEDQTLLQKKLSSGEITAEEALTFGQRHVILQSVGTEGLLKPAYYIGDCVDSDLFVLCCDGAYRKAEDEGIWSFFADADHDDESSLGRACQEMLRYDLEHGEKDNLTVVCVSAHTAAPNATAAVGQHGALQDAPAPLNLGTTYDLDGSEDDEPQTMVGLDDDADLPTVVEQFDEHDFDEAPTVVEGGES